MYRDILLAYDGSRESREALQQGAELARACGARVLLLAVAHPAEGLLPVEGPPAIVANDQDCIASDLLEGLATLRQRGLASEADLRFGNPAEQISAVAQERGADLIVIGHRNQSLFARWWNGSVGASVLDHAPCSILVAIKTPASLSAARERRNNRASVGSPGPVVPLARQGPRPD